MSSPQMREMNRIREQLSLERRKRSQEKIISQKRMKFLDMTQLLNETKMIEENIQPTPKSVTKQQLLNKLTTDKSPEFWAFVSKILDNEVKFKGANVFVKIWREVCTLENALEITESFLMKQPRIPSSQTVHFKEILVLCLKSHLNQSSYKKVLECISVFPNKQESFKEFISLFIEYLQVYQSDGAILQTTIPFITQITNILDEDTELSLNLISSFTYTLTQLSAQASDALLQIILYSISSLILHGSSIVDILISSQFLRQCILFFDQSNTKIKNILIVIIYNTIIVGNKQQIVYLIQNHLIDLVHYCIVNWFSIDCGHLCMKMYEKILVFVKGLKGECEKERFEGILEFVKIGSLYERMEVGEREGNDQFVKEESGKIRRIIEQIMGYGVEQTATMMEVQ